MNDPTNTAPQPPAYYGPPPADPRLIQPTLGRIVMGVFIGNMMFGLVAVLVWAMISSI